MTQKYIPLTMREIKKMDTEELRHDFNKGFWPWFQYQAMNLSLPQTNLFFRTRFGDPREQVKNLEYLGKIPDELKLLIYALYVELGFLYSHVRELNHTRRGTKRFSNLYSQTRKLEMNTVLTEKMIDLKFREEFSGVTSKERIFLSSNGAFVRRSNANLKP